MINIQQILHISQKNKIKYCKIQCYSSPNYDRQVLSGNDWITPPPRLSPYSVNGKTNLVSSEIKILPHPCEIVLSHAIPLSNYSSKYRSNFLEGTMNSTLVIFASNLIRDILI